MSAFVLATVTDQAALSAAAADIESRADEFRLRRVYDAQASGFAATLPVRPAT